MSGSAKKRREKQRRRERLVRQCRRAFETWMMSKRIAEERRGEFDAAFPGAREQYGEGSELVGMLRALHVYDANPIIAIKIPQETQ